MPTRRWPPADSAASITGIDVRPTPVAANVAPSGRNGRHAVSACAVPGIPPGTPMTRSTWTWPPYGGPYLSSSRRRVASWPRSKTSYSGTIPRCCIWVCSSTIRSHGLLNTSLPKFTVPSVSEAASGSASRTARRASNGSVTAPPLDSWTTRSVFSRTAATTSRTRPRSSVGLVSVSRTCRWTTAAPTRSQSFAVATTSSTVTGSAGTSAFADSAPVGATVMRVLEVTMSWLDSATAPLLARWRSLRCSRTRRLGPHRRRSHGLHPRTGGGHALLGLGRGVVRVDRGRRSGDGQGRVHGDRLLDQRERDHAELVVAHHGADPADLAGAREHRRPRLGQHLAHAVQVQQDQPPGRATQVVHPGDGLLPAVAALVEVDRGLQPLQFVRDGSGVASPPDPRAARLHAERLVRRRAHERCAQPVGDRLDVGARDDEVEHVRGAVPDARHAADEAVLQRGDGVLALRCREAGRRQDVARLRAHEREDGPLLGHQRGVHPQHEPHLLEEVDQPGPGAGLGV